MDAPNRFYCCDVRTTKLKAKPVKCIGKEHAQKGQLQHSCVVTVLSKRVSFQVGLFSTVVMSNACMGVELSHTQSASVGDSFSPFLHVDHKREGKGQIN